MGGVKKKCRWRNVSPLFIVPTCLKRQENDFGITIRLCDDCGKTDIYDLAGINKMVEKEQLKEWGMGEKRFTYLNASKTKYIGSFFCNDMPLTNDEVVDYLNNLHEENNKIKNILLNKKEELENDYNRGAKAGMPTGGIIGELDTIEDILEEMGWI